MLHKVVHKYKNIYFATIKMKPICVQLCTYIDYGFDHNEKDHKFKVGDHMRISK